METDRAVRRILDYLVKHGGGGDPLIQEAKAAMDEEQGQETELVSDQKKDGSE